jgi:hypothetical protein
MLDACDWISKEDCRQNKLSAIWAIFLRSQQSVLLENC